MWRRRASSPCTTPDRDAGRRPARHAPRPLSLPQAGRARQCIDRQLPGLYNARRDSLGKYWQGLFGVSHAVMMVESFFENVERDGKNQVLHFVPKPADTMLIACLCCDLAGPEGWAAAVVIRGDY